MVWFGGHGPLSFQFALGDAVEIDRFRYIWLLVGFHPAIRSEQRTPADNAHEGIRQYKETKLLNTLVCNKLIYYYAYLYWTQKQHVL